jgi:hypothetical protein
MDAQRGSDREALSPLGAPRIQHGPPAARAHALPEAMGALALNHGRLKGSFGSQVRNPGSSISPQNGKARY